MRPFLPATLIATAAIFAPAGAQTPAQPAETRLLLSAEAEVTAEPDIAEVGAGVLTQAGEASAALAQNAADMSRVIAALRKANVAEKDIQTSGLSVSPRFRYQQNEAPELVGFQASNQVRVKIRDPKNTGRVVDALVTAGANQINGPNFAIEHPEPLLDRARAEAVARARARAELYARAAGMTVGRIVSIRESGIANTPPRPVMRAMAAAESVRADSPVAPGEMQLSAGVEVEFALR